MKAFSGSALLHWLTSAGRGTTTRRLPFAPYYYCYYYDTNYYYYCYRRVNEIASSSRTSFNDGRCCCRPYFSGLSRLNTQLDSREQQKERRKPGGVTTEWTKGRNAADGNKLVIEIRRAPAPVGGAAVIALGSNIALIISLPLSFLNVAQDRLAAPANDWYPPCNCNRTIV